MLIVHFGVIEVSNSMIANGQIKCTLFRCVFCQCSTVELDRSIIVTLKVAAGCIGYSYVVVDGPTATNFIKNLFGLVELAEEDMAICLSNCSLVLKLSIEFVRFVIVLKGILRLANELEQMTNLYHDIRLVFIDLKAFFVKFYGVLWFFQLSITFGDIIGNHKVPWLELENLHKLVQSLLKLLILFSYVRQTT